jgi:hypothetical protein
MTEKAFRLDFFIAIAALIVSVLSTLTLLYQTHVIGQQYAATIWPYLSVVSYYSHGEERISVANDGLGPAIVKSAQLTVDGKTFGSWNDYLSMLTSALPKGTTANASLVSIGPATTIRPGESQQLFDIKYSSSVVTSSVLSHRVELAFCYCSLNSDCWLLHATAGSDPSVDNAPVRACSSRERIQSYRTPKLK